MKKLKTIECKPFTNEKFILDGSEMYVSEVFTDKKTGETYIKNGFSFKVRKVTDKIYETI